MTNKKKVTIQREKKNQQIFVLNLQAATELMSYIILTANQLQTLKLSIFSADTEQNSHFKSNLGTTIFSCTGGEFERIPQQLRKQFYDQNR